MILYPTYINNKGANFTEEEKTSLLKNNFINKIKNIGAYAKSVCAAPLISVILDGDNCWEYYKNDGWDFLIKLYEKLNSDTVIETIKISDYLKNFQPNSTITNLTAGSWINGNG